MPTSKQRHAQKYIAKMTRVVQPRFEELIGEWPDDERTIRRLFRLFGRHGQEVAWRALEKAADLSGPETTDEVVHAAFGFIDEWARRGWLR